MPWPSSPTVPTHYAHTMQVVGLELHPAKLWQLRRLVFGLGLAQIVGTGLVLAVAGHLVVGVDWPLAILIGFGLALSSTAIGLQILGERGDMASPYGQTAFAILLMQDIAIAPLLALVPLFKQQKSGVFLNIASTGGVSPRPNLTWYNASKGWVITATKAMAVELAPFGIRVNALNPVDGDTPLLKTFMGGDTPEVRAKFLASIPLGRFSTPEDMGKASAFLCSDDAGMITGVAMEVDGGRCI